MSWKGIFRKAGITIQGDTMTFRKNVRMTGQQINIASAWGVGITGAAIAVGDYLNAIAFGEVTEHVVGAVVHLSGSTDDDSNFIPIHGKFTTTADCVINATAQAVYGRVDILHNLSGSYGVRGAVSITGEPEINQAYGLFATISRASTCNLAITGYVAGLAVEMASTFDVTQTGGGYGKVCGIHIAWGETNAMTVETCGAHIAIAAGAKLDSGYRVNSSGTLTNAFHSHNITSTPTNGLKLEGAHTNAFAFPAEGTAPVSDTTNVVFGTDPVKISILIGSAQYYMLAAKDFS